VATLNSDAVYKGEVVRTTSAVTDMWGWLESRDVVIRPYEEHANTALT